MSVAPSTVVYASVASRSRGAVNVHLFQCTVEDDHFDCGMARLEPELRKPIRPLGPWVSARSEEAPRPLSGWPRYRDVQAKKETCRLTRAF
jgi:hypothetical protein